MDGIGSLPMGGRPGGGDEITEGDQNKAPAGVRGGPIWMFGRFFHEFGVFAHGGLGGQVKIAWKRYRGFQF